MQVEIQQSKLPLKPIFYYWPVITSTEETAAVI